MSVCQKQGGWKGLCTRDTGRHTATRAFLDPIESPRIAIPFHPGAKGSLTPRAGFMGGNLGGTALIERELRKVLDILDNRRNNCPNHHGTRNENPRDGS